MATYCLPHRILVTTALFTGASDEPAPGAVAIGGDRILWAGPLETMPEALRGDATEVIDYGDALSCRAFTTPTFITSIPRCTSPLWPSASWAKTRPMPWLRLAASGCRRPADSWLLTQGWRDYLWNPAGMPSPRVTGCGLPHTSRGHVLRGRPHAVAEQLRAGTPGHHGGERAAAGGSYDKDADGALRASCARQRPWSSCRASWRSSRARSCWTPTAPSSGT